VAKTGYIVQGRDETPDGYHDFLAYKGTSKWQVFKAIRAALANDMSVTISRYLIG
jgi:hypothetical protein